MDGQGPGFEPAGSLGGHVYARLLSLIFHRKTSGLLTLTRDEDVKKVYLREGFIVYASTSRHEERLGDILLREGVITREQYDQTGLLLKKTGRKQGSLLVEMGALTPKDLFRWHILQVTEIAESPILWDDGSYQYEGDYDRGEEMIYLKLHPGRVIRSGFFKRPLEGEFASGSGLVFKINPDHDFDPDDLPLSPLEKKILSSVPRGKTPADIAALTGFPVGDVMKNYEVLTKLGLLTLPASEAPEPVESTPENPGEEVSDAPAGGEVLDRQSELLDFHRKLPRMNFYQILDVETEASPMAVKKAFIRKAKEYHPDRFYGVELEKFAAMANEVFMKINEAYGILGGEDSRREYDREISRTPGRSPRAESEGDPGLAAEQFKKGVRLMKCGEDRQAVDIFKWAVRLSPDNPLYHSYLGLALMKTGRRLKEAEEHLKTAITLDYNNPQLYLNLGLIYKRGKVPQKAEEAFQRVLKIDPGNERAREELALLSKKPKNEGGGNRSALGRLFRS